MNHSWKHHRTAQNAKRSSSRHYNDGARVSIQFFLPEIGAIAEIVEVRATKRKTLVKERAQAGPRLQRDDVSPAKVANL